MRPRRFALTQAILRIDFYRPALTHPLRSCGGSTNRLLRSRPGTYRRQDEIQYNLDTQSAHRNRGHANIRGGGIALKLAGVKPKRRVSPEERARLQAIGYKRGSPTQEDGLTL